MRNIFSKCVPFQILLVSSSSSCEDERTLVFNSLVKDEQERNAYTFGFGFWALEFDLKSYQSMNMGPRSGQKNKGEGLQEKQE